MKISIKMFCSDFKLVWVLGGLCILVSFSNASEQSDNFAEISRVLGSSFSVFNRCADKDFTLCLKVNLLLQLRRNRYKALPCNRFIRILTEFMIDSIFHDKEIKAST